MIDLRDHSSLLSDQEFEQEVQLNFTTILSHGEEVNLRANGDTERVTKANLPEYIDLVMKTRFNEAKE